MKQIELTPFQAKVSALPEVVDGRPNNLVFGGGRGSSKTWAIFLLAIRDSVRYGANYRGLLTRAKLKSLVQARTEIDFLLRGAYGKNGFTYSGSDTTFRMSNGATLQLGHCADERAVADWMGLSLSHVYLDEFHAAPTWEVFEQLALSVRSTQIPTRIILACNPLGKNHATIGAKFFPTDGSVKPWNPTEVDGRLWTVCPSTVYDGALRNDREYIAALEAITDPMRRAAFLEGRWDVMIGDFWEGTWSNRLVYDPRDVPLDCFSSMQLGIDPSGGASPWAVLVGGRLRHDVRLPDDRVMPAGAFCLHDELYIADPQNLSKGRGWTPSQCAPHIHRLAAGNQMTPRGVIDPAGFAHQMGAGTPSIGEALRLHGIAVRPASRALANRADGWLAMKDAMVKDQFWVSSACPHWLRTTPVLQRSPLDPDDLEKGGEDHLADGSRYLFLAMTYSKQIGVSTWR